MLDVVLGMERPRHVLRDEPAGPCAGCTGRCVLGQQAAGAQGTAQGCQTLDDLSSVHGNPRVCTLFARRFVVYVTL